MERRYHKRGLGGTSLDMLIFKAREGDLVERRWRGGILSKKRKYII